MMRLVVLNVFFVGLLVWVGKWGEGGRCIDIVCDVGVEVVEDDVIFGEVGGVWFVFVDDYVVDGVWDGVCEFLVDDMGVLLFCGFGGGVEGVEGKVGVGGEEFDEVVGWG